MPTRPYVTQEFTQTFFLSAGETDAKGRISLPLLTSKIIDIATAHANSLGIGNPSMAHLRRGWVLSRLAIEMTDYPRVNGSYSLTTWIESWNRHFSERIIAVTLADGSVAGYARTVWMVLDTETRESVGLSHLSLPEGIVSERVCPIAKQGKHHPIMYPDFEGDLPRGAFRASEQPDSYTFKYCDLDYYRHVNTVRYVALLLNRFTLPFLDSNAVERMELTFMHELHYGDTVDILRHEQAAEADGRRGVLMSLTKAGAAPSLFAALRFRPTP